MNGNWTYTYDDFNRLASSAKTGVTYTYVYDRFGNRWQQNNGWRSSLSFDANNHILPSNGMYYDAAGNLTNDSFHTYGYDAENRLISVDSGATTYAYDGADRRVRKATGGSTSDYLYDQSGRVITEIDGTSTWTRGEVYAGSKHLATYASGFSGTTYFEHADWLGTSRARSGVSGSSAETCTSLAFGDGLSCAGTEPSPLHFTGKQRDSETTLDHFWYRQYSSAEARWVTADPIGKKAAKPANPQTWDLYAYVANAPLTRKDCFGHMMVLVPSPCGITLEGENTCTGDAGGGFMVFPIFLSFDFGGGGGGGGDSDNSCHPRTARFPIGGIDLCQELPGKPTLVQSWVCDDGTMECCRGKVGEFTSPCEKRGKEYVATYREFSTFILAACCRK